MHAQTIHPQMFLRRSIFLFLCFVLFCCAYHHNGNAMLSSANMRKYGPCHAFPKLFEARVKEHIVQNLALSLHPVLQLHFPVKIKNIGRAEPSIVFWRFLLHISSQRGLHVEQCKHAKVWALPCFSHLIQRQTAANDGDGPYQ